MVRTADSLSCVRTLLAASFNSCLGQLLAKKGVFNFWTLFSKCSYLLVILLVWINWLYGKLFFRGTVWKLSPEKVIPCNLFIHYETFILLANCDIKKMFCHFQKWMRSLAWTSSSKNEMAANYKCWDGIKTLIPRRCLDIDKQSFLDSRISRLWTCLMWSGRKLQYP